MPRHKRYASEFATLSSLRNIHAEAQCRGQVCVIHNPTDHHMRRWPLIWRDDRQILERICVHGTGHPDPDHLPYWAATGRDDNRWHGCCDCCAGRDGV